MDSDRHLTPCGKKRHAEEVRVREPQGAKGTYLPGPVESHSPFRVNGNINETLMNRLTLTEIKYGK